MEVATEKVQVFVLSFFRMAGLFFMAPVLGDVSVPKVARVAIAFAFTLAVAPVVATPASLPGSLWAWPLVIGKELVIGLAVGYVSSLIFSATLFSGEILGYYMGFGVAQIYDPTFDTEVSLVGQFETMAAMLLFFSLNCHHWVVSAVTHSFGIIPLGGLMYDGEAAMTIVKMVGAIFPVAIQIVAPAFVVLVLATITLGIVARTVPQMNVLIVGLPLKIAVGLIGVAVSLPMFGQLLARLFAGLQRDVVTLLHMMS